MMVTRVHGSCATSVVNFCISSNELRSRANVSLKVAAGLAPNLANLLEAEHAKAGLTFVRSGRGLESARRTRKDGRIIPRAATYRSLLAGAGAQRIFGGRFGVIGSSKP